MLDPISNIEVRLVVYGENYWEIAKPYIEIALKESCNYGVIDRIGVLIKSRRYRLFLIYDPVCLLGAAVTCTEEGGLGEYWYNILYLYILPMTPTDFGVRDYVVSRLEVDAIKIGCTHIHFLSARNGGLRLARRYGYEKRFVEYAKKL